jgi:hypothetical protein
VQFVAAGFSLRAVFGPLLSFVPWHSRRLKPAATTDLQLNTIYVFFLNAAWAEITINNVMPKSKVHSALTSGFTPKRTIEYIRSGKISKLGPVTK